MVTSVFLVKVTLQNLKEKTFRIKYMNEIHEIDHLALQIRWTVFIFD